jgi:hypothetical protein
MIYLWFALFVTFVIFLVISIIETVCAIKDNDPVRSADLMVVNLWAAFLAGTFFIAFLESFLELIA